MPFQFSKGLKFDLKLFQVSVISLVAFLTRVYISWFFDSKQIILFLIIFLMGFIFKHSSLSHKWELCLMINCLNNSGTTQNRASKVG